MGHGLNKKRKVLLAMLLLVVALWAWNGTRALDVLGPGFPFEYERQISWRYVDQQVGGLSGDYSNVCQESFANSPVVVSGTCPSSLGSYSSDSPILPYLHGEWQGTASGCAFLANPWCSARSFVDTSSTGLSITGQKTGWELLRPTSLICTRGTIFGIGECSSLKKQLSVDASGNPIYQNANETNPWLLPFPLSANYTRPDGTIVVQTQLVVYRILRIWMMVTVTVAGDTLSARYCNQNFYGCADGASPSDSTTILGSLSSALANMKNNGHMTNGTLVLGASVPGWAIQSNTDWYGWVGAWVGDPGGASLRQNMGCSGNDLVLPSDVHSAIDLWKTPQSVLTQDPTMKAFKVVKSFATLPSYNLTQLINLQRSVLSPTVYFGLKLADFGPTYSSAQCGLNNPGVSNQGACNPVTSLPSCIYWDANIKRQIPVVFDLATTSLATFYTTYLTPILTSAFGSIAGHATTSFLGLNQSLPGVRIAAGLNGKGFGAATTTDGGGNYALGGLQSGYYTVDCFIPDQQITIAKALPLIGDIGLTIPSLYSEAVYSVPVVGGYQSAQSVVLQSQLFYVIFAGIFALGVIVAVAVALFYTAKKVGPHVVDAAKAGVKLAKYAA